MYELARGTGSLVCRTASVKSGFERGGSPFCPARAQRGRSCRSDNTFRWVFGPAESFSERGQTGASERFGLRGGVEANGLSFQKTVPPRHLQITVRWNTWVLRVLCFVWGARRLVPFTTSFHLLHSRYFFWVGQLDRTLSGGWWRETLLSRLRRRCFHFLLSLTRDPSHDIHLGDLLSEEKTRSQPSEMRVCRFHWFKSFCEGQLGGLRGSTASTVCGKIPRPDLSAGRQVEGATRHCSDAVQSCCG